VIDGDPITRRPTHDVIDGDVPLAICY